MEVDKRRTKDLTMSDHLKNALMRMCKTCVASSETSCFSLGKAHFYFVCDSIIKRLWQRCVTGKVGFVTGDDEDSSCLGRVRMSRVILFIGWLF